MYHFPTQKRLYQLESHSSIQLERPTWGCSSPQLCKRLLYISVYEACCHVYTHVLTPPATPSRTGLERFGVLLLLLQFPLQRFACHGNIFFSLSHKMLIRYPAMVSESPINQDFPSIGVVLLGKNPQETMGFSL